MNGKNLLSLFTTGLTACRRNVHVTKNIRPHFAAFAYNPRNYATKKKLVPETPDRFGHYSGTEKLVFLNCDVDQKSKEYKRLLVMFYAPWCRHSIVLKPEFAKAAALADLDDCRLGVVDCNYHYKAVDKFQIDGFPTLLLFEDGELKEEYDGPRKAKDILSYIENKAGSDGAKSE